MRLTVCASNQKTLGTQPRRALSSAKIEMQLLQCNLGTDDTVFAARGHGPLYLRTHFGGQRRTSTGASRPIADEFIRMV